MEAGRKVAAGLDIRRKVVDRMEVADLDIHHKEVPVAVRMEAAGLDNLAAVAVHMDLMHLDIVVDRMDLMRLDTVADRMAAVRMG